MKEARAGKRIFNMIARGGFNRMVCKKCVSQPWERWRIAGIFFFFSRHAATTATEERISHGGSKARRRFS